MNERAERLLAALKKIAEWRSFPPECSVDEHLIKIAEQAIEADKNG